VRNHAFPLQNASPDIETILPIAILRRRVFAVAVPTSAAAFAGAFSACSNAHRPPLSRIQFPAENSVPTGGNRETVGIFSKLPNM